MKKGNMRVGMGMASGIWLCMNVSENINWQSFLFRSILFGKTRPVTYLCLWTLRISFKGCERVRLFVQEGGSGYVSGSHIEW
jgi:hypothetical protein